MSILSKEQIEQLANDHNVMLFGYNFQNENLQACSYDLRIGTIYKNSGSNNIFNTKRKIYSNNFNSDDNWCVEIKPSEIVTILTLEELNMPLNISGTVFTMNSLSSTGFLILNPGHIDPGYKGPISICAINLSKNSIKLFYGKKIFTIIFDKLEFNAEPYENFKPNNRKDYEQIFYRKRASKLSQSLFDLILENEYTPYLSNLIKTIIKQLVYKILAWVFGALVIIAGLLKGYEVLKDLI